MSVPSADAPFAALASTLAALDVRVLVGLTRVERATLENIAAGRPVRPPAAARALLGAVKQISIDSDVLFVIHDLPRLDADPAGRLGFVVRRLACARARLVGACEPEAAGASPVLTGVAVRRVGVVGSLRAEAHSAGGSPVADAYSAGVRRSPMRTAPAVRRSAGAANRRWPGRRPRDSGLRSP